MLRYIGMIFCAALIAMGNTSCQTLDQADAVVKNNLPKACSLALSGHNAFRAYVEIRPVSSKITQKEAIAYSGVQEICANPNDADAVSAALSVARAYAVIVSAIRDAKAQGG